MPRDRVIQVYRGTTAQNDAFTGAAGEITMDTTTNELRVHDGTTAGGHKIGRGYRPELFTPQWSDHIIDDMNWARSDTFSWLPKSGNNGYPVAYDHLVADISGKSLQTETIGGTTVGFYLADDGHKICPASEESNVAAIYAATGVAWYYIIDTTNQRFKLPRTKFGMTGLRDTVGNYVAPGLPNITSYLNASGLMDYRSAPATNWYNRSGAFDVYVSGNDYTDKGFRSGSAVASSMSLSFDASRSSSIYGNDTTVQPPATQMYLYFYVGNFTQSAIENTAGLNAELFNGKADLDFANTNMIDYVIEKQAPTAGNNYMWYRKYKSGWVEQGGYVSGQGDGVNKTITYPVAFTSRVCDYNVHNTRGSGADQYAFQIGVTADPGLTSMVVRTVCNGTTNYVWSVKGF